MEEIGTDELTLLPRESRVRRKRVFHLIGARFEGLYQLAMTRLKVLEDFRQLLLGHVRSEREHPIDNVICTRLVGGVEVPRLGRRPEWPHHDPRRVGPQEQVVALQ